MKKVIATILSMIATHACATDLAHIKISVNNPTKQNKYFLCVYGVGCLSIRAGDEGKRFPIAPMDVANIQKFVITDVSDMSMSAQPSHESCQVKVDTDQTLTISGQLTMKNNKPYIDNLRCSVS